MSGFHAEGRYCDVSVSEDVLIRAAAERLAAAGVSGALVEARRLWAHVGGDPHNYDAFVARRVAREPMSHILGYRDFYKHRFAVTADVLDPRPDTETLVEAALTVPFEQVLDLGTGSGCILLSLLAERGESTGVGTDRSQAALAVAAQNAEALEVSDRVTFLQSDWFTQIDGSFDLIVSNPPYIAANEMAALQPEVRDHEPRVALTDEGDGLACYRAIIAAAPAFLTGQGVLMFEIGPTQAAEVTELMSAQGFDNLDVIKDLNGRDRVVSGQLSAS